MAESRFIRFCIKGLEKSFIPSEQLFATRRLNDRQMIHSRDSNHEYLFTMLALLGLHQAKIKGSEVFLDTEAVFQKMVLKIDEQVDQVPCVAATAWAARSMGVTMPSRANTLFQDLLKQTRQMNI